MDNRHTFAPGNHVQYYSESQHKYLDAQVLQVNAETGEVELDVRPGRWIPPSSVRPAASTVPTTAVGALGAGPGVGAYPPPTVTYGGDARRSSGASTVLQAGDKVYLFSHSKDKWIPANVLNVDPHDGSVELDCKRGCRIHIPEQEQRIKRTKIPTGLRVGDEVLHWTDTQVTVAKVSQVDAHSGSVQLDITPGIWYSSYDQQRHFRVALNPEDHASRPLPTADAGAAYRGERRHTTQDRDGLGGSPAGHAGRYPVHSQVEYFSSTNGYWIPAVVVGHNDNGSYALDVNPQAAPEKVRPRGGPPAGTKIVSPAPPGGGAHHGAPPHSEKKKVAAGSSDSGENVLEGTIVTDNPNVDWEDIAGLHNAKEQLKLAVVLPTVWPKLFSEERPPPKGILMYGPPGTGKTYLAKACATACVSTFFQVKPSDIMSKYQGESEQHVAKLFDMAKDRAPAIIFIDEIDAFFGKREKDSGGSSRAVKNVFLQSMEQFTGASQPGKTCLVLGATNLPWDLDDAFIRRFQAKIYIPLPDVDARRALLNIVLGERRKDLRDEDVEFLVQSTAGFSGSDVKNLSQNAIMRPVRDLQAAKAFKRHHAPNEHGVMSLYWMPCEPSEAGAINMNLLQISEGEPFVRPVTLADFEAARSEVKSSVKESSLAKFDEWTDKYGMQGT